MPTTVKSGKSKTYYEPHNTYSSRAYSGRQIYGNTSSAYDIPPVYPGRSAAPPKPIEKNTVSVDRYVSKGRITKMMVLVVIAFALCCTIIYRYASILESNQKINALEKQYIDVLATNQALQSKIDRGLEMGEIEEYARKELGMMKPESAQIFYVDMKLSDDGASSQRPDGNTVITGTPGALVNAFRVLK